MCTSGSAIDATTFYGFKLSHSNLGGGSNINLAQTYFVEENYTFNPNSSNSTNISLILTVLNNSICSCQNVLFKVIFIKFFEK